MNRQVVLITGASSGFGALGQVGHIVYAGILPFRVHVDPAEDGAEIVNGVADRVRAELLRRIGLEDLLKPASRF